MNTPHITKPCFCCKQPAELAAGDKFFDAHLVFEDWATRNQIISPDRSRFDGVRSGLAWAALDETDEGAHAACALGWIVQREGFGGRYPAAETP
jgi:hypothetical protein